MATINQIIKKPRRRKQKKNNSFNCQPYASGVCLKVFTLKPKKPNSALRKVARVRLSTKKIINCHIPGEGHSLQQFGRVLVRGGRTRDLPGVRHKLVRGKFDLHYVLNRKSSRSKYGTPKPK